MNNTTTPRTPGRAVGAPAPRVEGPLKLTGKARYSMDNQVAGMLHAVLVGATVAHGRVVDVDAEAAARVDGVVAVHSRHDMPTFGPLPAFQAGMQTPPMQTDDIHYEGAPVAIVIAETLQAAEEARPLVRVSYDSEPPVLPGQGKREVVEAALKTGPEGFSFWPYGRTFRNGDAGAALELAAVRIDRSYHEQTRHHNPMETSGILAHWDGDRLTVWDSIQGHLVLPPVFASVFDIDPEDVRVIAPFTGGGFGCKGFVWPHQILAAASARVLDRAVKLHLRRQDQYTATGYSPEITQRVELGADRDGRLLAYRHRATNITGLFETYVEAPTEVRDLYAAQVIDVDQDVERVTVGCPTPMRTTNEGHGLWALENAMNELAHAVGIDPLDLRLRNYAEKDPVHGRPWSSKKLREAYEEGAELFGWRERPRGGTDDGHWRVGRGMATAASAVMRMPGRAKVRLSSDGGVRIETNCQDIGTGLQTSLTQIAADELGVPLNSVTIAWGDSTLPTTGPVWGSATMHTGSAVVLACRDLRKQLAAISRSSSVVEAIREAKLDEVVGDATSVLPGDAPADYGGGSSGYTMGTWGAMFVEVAIDPQLGLLRLRRLVGSFSVGRVLNPKMARSQATGGVVWSWTKATMEQSEMDPIGGRWLSKNLSGVDLATNADIPPDITVHFVDEYDEHASQFGGRAIGEVVSTGIEAAVADAIFDGVGVRLRDLPMTPKRLLDALEAKGS